MNQTIIISQITASMHRYNTNIAMKLVRAAEEAIINWELPHFAECKPTDGRTSGMALTNETLATSRSMSNLIESVE